MTTRKASVAGSFYPYDKQSCRRQIETCLGNYHPPSEPEHVIAGIVPHAGWIFSGPTAAKVFKSIQEKTTPDTFIIFGAVHVWGVGQQAAMFAHGSWETPCGTSEIDETLAATLLKSVPEHLTAAPSAHNREHSIEVQLPFIQYLFPNAKILPIMVTPDKYAPVLGQKIGKILAEQKNQVVVLGSTDLTHYGPRFSFTPYGIGEQSLSPMKENDRHLIDLVTHMQSEEILREAEHHRNACGAGAIASTVGAAKELGATQGYLLEHTTSQDVMPDRHATDFVGYAGIIF
jgi:AmmeMemoRadiSam system protein B